MISNVALYLEKPSAAKLGNTLVLSTMAVRGNGTEGQLCHKSG